MTCKIPENLTVDFCKQIQALTPLLMKQVLLLSPFYVNRKMRKREV